MRKFGRNARLRLHGDQPLKFTQGHGPLLLVYDTNLYGELDPPVFHQVLANLFRIGMAYLGLGKQIPLAGFLIFYPSLPEYGDRPVGHIGKFLIQEIPAADFGKGKRSRTVHGVQVVGNRIGIRKLQ
jgi:hypothetical protein